MTNHVQNEYILRLLKEKHELQLKVRKAEASKQKAIERSKIHLQEKEDMRSQLKITEQLRKLEQKKCRNLIVEKVG